MYLKSLDILNFRKFYYGGDIKKIIKENSGSSDTYFEFVHTDDSENISGRTTLIVGQNNTGKTTIAYFLEAISRNDRFSIDDLNYNYLSKIIGNILNKKKKDKDIVIDDLPMIAGVITIGLDDKQNNNLNNLRSFVNIKGNENDDVTVKMCWEIENSAKVLEKLNEYKLIVNEKEPKQALIENKNNLEEIFLDINFKVNYYNYNNNKVNVKSNEHFLDVKFIKANNVTDDKVLSSSFNQIMKHYIDETDRNLKDSVERINRDIDADFIKLNNIKINEKLASGNLDSKIEVKLESSLTVDTVMRDLIKYGYVENGNIIKENRYGLGYTRIILILSEILHYINDYNEIDENIKINILFIEEPEAFMHPQLQKKFMENLSRLVNEFLKTDNDSKKINSQLIISTHSDHILNSKINQSKSFDNINYLALENTKVKNIVLKDNKIINDGDKDTINFIIKHMKNNMEQLFFSDALIFVEGLTEYFYLKNILHSHNILKNKFVSVYIVGGTHMEQYINLIKTLQIPTAIITDIDIKNIHDKRNKSDDYYENVNSKSIDGRETTNPTFSKLLNFDTKEAMSLSNIFRKLEEQDDELNYKIFTQTIKDYNEYLPTSFEEALILDNFKIKTFKKVLEQTIPNLYKEHKDNLKEKSRFLQIRLADNSKKTTFVSYLIELDDLEKEKTVMPKYIERALGYLANKLEGIKND